MIALPYGPGANWVRNVLASGSATIVHEGQTLDVDRPEIVSMILIRTPSLCSRARSRFTNIRSRSNSASISVCGRFQFSVENA